MGYGSFLQLWLIGSLVLYLMIQVIVIGLIAPKMKQMKIWFEQTKTVDVVPDNIQLLHSRIRSQFVTACAIGLVLFVFMIMKP